MQTTRSSIENILNSIPFIGILAFVILYIYSASHYPGGSQSDATSEGFDWVHNYWCNLMNAKGMNGLPNPARPFAVSAMIILCASIMVFFIQFARTYSKNKFWRQTIIICGTLSMLLAMFIFTQYHDLMTILSSVFGLFVVLGIIRELYKSDLLFYKLTGVFCIVLLGVNNYIYYTQDFLEVLPLLQKVTFAIVLIWILGLNAQMIKDRKKI